VKHLWLAAWADIVESLRSRWFQVYTAIFGGVIVLLFLFGITESRIMGFTGPDHLYSTGDGNSAGVCPDNDGAFGCR